MSPQRRIIAEGLRGDVGVHGAADVKEQARIVGLGGDLRIDTQPVAQPHCGQSAVQPMFQLHAKAQVGGERQRRDQLRGTNPFLAWRDNVRHPPTLPGRSSRPLRSRGGDFTPPPAPGPVARKR